MNDYVAKPLRPEQLYAALARAGGESGEVDLPDLGELPPKASVRLDLKAALQDIGDIELFATMVGMLLAEWDDHLDRVQKALVAVDARQLRMHAHTLKSLLAMFHAEHARRLAMEIENSAMSVEAVDWPGCQRLYGELADEMAQIRPVLKRFVDTRVIP
jgi:HPt (histidine-containing phosphotransfer) domain-containing protein